MIRFSIITIVRNDASGVIATLQSVFSQTYQNFELIVQDGASDDGTSDVLRGLAHWIDDLAIAPDTGIYDAMNKALRRATGDYCIFMNAADVFVNDTVLERVAQAIDRDVDDIWSGQVVQDETGALHKYRPPEQFWLGSTFDHQAAFIRTSLLQHYEHDTQYRISGDLEFFTRARKGGARFKQDEIVVARKPFAVGASSGFLDRFNDRFSMLEAAWGDTYPVRETLRLELAQHLSATLDLPQSSLSELSIPELLAQQKLWSNAAGQ